jgi:sec-independent protein translocase protein TatA
MGNGELILVVVVLLLLFGATKLPKLARSMGQSVGEFKKGLKDGNEPDSKAPPADTEAK